MAAITKHNPRMVSPAGYEMAFIAYATEEISRGDLVIITPDTPPGGYDHSVEVATGGEAHGIALKDTRRGGRAEIAWRGEFDGYSGMTPGQQLSVVSGQIDDMEPEEGETLPVHPAIRVVTPSRIRFDFT